jgi:hypothetical protein
VPYTPWKGKQDIVCSRRVGGGNGRRDGQQALGLMITKS